MKLGYIYHAALLLGHSEPISIEPDGTIWLGTDNDRTYLTDTQLEAIHNKVAEMQNDFQNAKQSARDKLAALGLSDAEIAALVG